MALSLKAGEAASYSRLQPYLLGSRAGARRAPGHGDLRASLLRGSGSRKLPPLRQKSPCLPETRSRECRRLKTAPAAQAQVDKLP